MQRLEDAVVLELSNGGGRMGRGEPAGEVGLGREGLEEDAQMIPRAFLSWNSSIPDSLPRNMFPANLVEATFKQVSGSPGDEGVAGRASLGPTG